jgi:hypothetical protein
MADWCLQQLVRGTLLLANGATTYPVPLLPLLQLFFGFPLWRCLRSVAAKLRAAGYDGEATMLADSVYTEGNLRVLFPGARIVLPPFPPDAWPAARDSGPCLLVWPAKEASAPVVPEHLVSLPGSDLHAHPNGPHRDGIVFAPLFGDEASGYRLACRLYPAPTGDYR